MAEVKGYEIQVTEQLKELDDLVCFHITFNCNIMYLYVICKCVLDIAYMHLHQSEM